MRLQLQYTNVSRQKLILYRGNNLFYQTKIRPVLTDPAAQPYEVVVLNARYFDERPEKIDRASPGRAFVILPPGAAYETEMVVGVGVVGEGVQRDNTAITEGEYSLHLIVSTWYESRPLAEKLRQRWQREGLLWYDPVVSLPLRFTVEKHRSVERCQ